MQAKTPQFLSSRQILKFCLLGLACERGLRGRGGGTVNTPSEQDGILPPPSPAQELHPMAALAGHTRNGPTNRGKGVLS